MLTTAHGKQIQLILAIMVYISLRGAGRLGGRYVWTGSTEGCKADDSVHVLDLLLIGGVNVP